MSEEKHEKQKILAKNILERVQELDTEWLRDEIQRLAAVAELYRHIKKMLELEQRKQRRSKQITRKRRRAREDEDEEGDDDDDDDDLDELLDEL